jgi:hypothetical protein
MVAFDSASQVLLACVGGSWTQIALPAGIPGPQGPKGDPGLDGHDGTNGTDGASSLVTTASEEPGGHCAAGGTKLSFGLDDNRNGVLDADEVSNVAYVCHGVSATDTDAGHCAETGCAPPGPNPCDQDGDGFVNAGPSCGTGGPLDCNDADPTIFPGAPDVCSNGIAENCVSDAPCLPSFCELDADCPLGTFCANAYCTKTCQSDADCFTGAPDCIVDFVDTLPMMVCR